MFGHGDAAPGAAETSQQLALIVQQLSALNERLGKHEEKLHELTDKNAQANPLAKSSSHDIDDTVARLSRNSMKEGEGHLFEHDEEGHEKHKAKDMKFLAKFQSDEILGHQPGDKRGSLRGSVDKHHSPVKARRSSDLGGMIDNYTLRERFAGALPTSCTFLPESKMMEAWNLVAFVFICLIAISLPYRIAFIDRATPTTPAGGPDVIEGWSVIDFIIDVFFLFDIALNFRTAYVDDATGNIVTNNKKMALRYLRTWFILDLVASFPFDWCASGVSFYRRRAGESGGNEGGSFAALAALLRLLKLLKLLRLLRLARLLKLLRGLEDEILHAVNAQTLRLLVIVLVVILIAHWNGCAQFTIASLDREYDNVTGAWTIHEDTWIYRAGLLDKEPGIQWSWCFYQGMTQLLSISEGVVPPLRSSEMWAYLISILIGATLYAIFVASITSIFADSFASGRLYRAKLDQMLVYMKHTRMPKNLGRKLRAHFELTFPGRTMFDEDAIINSLSHPLRGEIALHKFQRVLESLQVLSDGSLSRAIACVLERLVFVHNDVIIFEGELGTGMYFISAGAVEVLIPKTADGTAKMKRAKLGDGASKAMSHEIGGTSAEEEFDVYEVMQVVSVLGPQAFFGEMALLNQKVSSAHTL